MAEATLLFRVLGIIWLALFMLAAGMFAARMVHLVRRWWRARRG